MELKIVSIADVGQPNERVILEAISKCDIGKFLLFTIANDEEGIIANKERYVFIFPSTIVEPGDYVSVFTKTDTYIGSYKNQKGTNTYAFNWNIDASLWQDQWKKICLVRYDLWEFFDLRTK